MSTIDLSQKNSDNTVGFTAPEAEVLIVDDNQVSLTMVKGLLKPLQMKIQTASSGREAINKIVRRRFDLIFMDHRMPEMSGIETTLQIRLMERGREVPIIGLSADTSKGIQEKFLDAGMSDYIEKPVKSPTIIAKIKQWLPPEKVHDTDAVFDDENQEDIPDAIGDLDIRTASELFGSWRVYFIVLEAYYKSIEKKAAVIEEAMQQENWERYTVEVHGLRGISEQIGAKQLADMAGELEDAGDAGDIDFIKGHTASLIEKYRGYISVLEPFFPKEESPKEKEKVPDGKLEDSFQKMKEAIDNLDIRQLESILADLKKYSFDEDDQEFFEFLEESVEDMDTEACMAVIGEWEVCL